MSEVNIKGLADIEKALGTLPDKIAQNVMRGGLRAGAKVIADEARATSQFADQTGKLRASIKSGTTLDGASYVGYVRAGRRNRKDKKNPFYALFIEFGTKQHTIRAKKGKALRIGVARVEHPGIRPRPFLREAFDKKSVVAIEAVRDYVRRRLSDKYDIDTPDPGGEGDE